MAPVKYTSYAKSKAQRRTDVAQMRAADRASAAYQARRSVPKLLPNETKYFDTSFLQNVATGNDWTGTEVPCTNYIQSDGTTVGAYTDSALIPSAIGAGYGQINGNKYYLKKLRVKGRLVTNAISDQADVLPAFSSRLVLVMDTQPQGAQAQGEQVFTDMGSAAQCDYSFLAMAAGSGGRFRILKDKVYIHQPAVAGTDGAATLSITNTGVNFKFNYNFSKPIQVMLKANSATPNVASLSNFNIFLLCHTSGSATILGCARAYFVD